MFIGLAVTALFKVVNVPMQDTIEKFVQLAIVTAENQKEHFTGPVENDVYQSSALPWIAFTHISHTDFGNRKTRNPYLIGENIMKEKANL